MVSLSLLCRGGVLVSLWCCSSRLRSLAVWSVAQSLDNNSELLELKYNEQTLKKTPQCKYYVYYVRLIKIYSSYSLVHVLQNQSIHSLYNVRKPLSIPGDVHLVAPEASPPRQDFRAGVSSLPCSPPCPGGGPVLAGPRRIRRGCFQQHGSPAWLLRR